MAAEIFQNHQRISLKSGILKAEAVFLFANALLYSSINDFVDLSPDKLKDAEEKILSLPGQKSGISFEYFKMLAGDDNLIKPDRMVQRFVKDALAIDKEPKSQETAVLVTQAARALKTSNERWSLLNLDYAIWEHQRTMLT